VPVPTDTFDGLHLAVSQAEVLLQILEEYLNVPLYPVGTGGVPGRCVIDMAFNRVDALFQPIDVNPPA
jgi:hypothetical protein